MITCLLCRPCTNISIACEPSVSFPSMCVSSCRHNQSDNLLTRPVNSLSTTSPVHPVLWTVETRVGDKQGSCCSREVVSGGDASADMGRQHALQGFSENVSLSPLSLCPSGWYWLKLTWKPVMSAHLCGPAAGVGDRRNSGIATRH